MPICLPSFAGTVAPASGGGAFTNQYSVSFDGTDDYATATLGSQVFDGDFAISFWFNADTAPAYTSLIQSGSSSSYNDGFRIYRYSNTALAFWKGQGGYSNIFGNIGTTATGSWHHIVVTRSGSTSTFYLNGSSIDTGTDSQSYTSTAFQMSFTTYPFDGLMDEVALWDSALSASNVTSIYNSGVPNDISSLSPVNWWRMGDNDGASGTTITDQGSGSNDATLTNGPTFSTDVPYVLPSLSNTLSGSFDGTDDYLTANESNLATSGDCTISLWFNSASLPGSGAYDYLFSLTDSRVTGKDRAIGIIGTGSDAQIIANTYASGWNLPFTNTSISANTWYHVAVVFTSSSAQVYFNGADKGSKTVATYTIAYTQTVIGGMLYSSANHFNGKIDEVSVFHSALSSTDITAIYNSGVPADISSLSPKGWWRNGDGTGDTDSGGGAPANTDTIGTVANQGSVNTGSGEGNMTGTNGPTFSSSVPS